MTEPLHALDVAMFNAGIAAGHLSKLDPKEIGDERMCELTAQVAQATALAAIASLLGEVTGTSKDGTYGHTLIRDVS